MPLEQPTGPYDNRYSLEMRSNFNETGHDIPVSLSWKWDSETPLEAQEAIFQRLVDALSASPAFDFYHAERRFESWQKATPTAPEA
jgi:hypothetical protein